MTSKKDSVIDLAPHVDKKVRVKFVGGREVVGILMGADPICNLVLDETVELLRDSNDQYMVHQGHTRSLGLIIARGPTVLSICDEEGAEIDVKDIYGA